MTHPSRGVKTIPSPIPSGSNTAYRVKGTVGCTPTTCESTTMVRPGVPIDYVSRWVPSQDFGRRSVLTGPGVGVDGVRFGPVIPSLYSHLCLPVPSEGHRWPTVHTGPVPTVSTGPFDVPGHPYRHVHALGVPGTASSAYRVQRRVRRLVRPDTHRPPFNRDPSLSESKIRTVV